VSRKPPLKVPMEKESQDEQADEKTKMRLPIVI
jgi:hypothetical protein